MDIVGDRKFVEVPGGKTHELPPLLVRTGPAKRRLHKILDVAGEIVEQEDMIPFIHADNPADEEILERRRMDLACNLVDQYLGLLAHWQWGDAVIEWIRQCEITFGARLELRNLLNSDIWPHAGRSSFIKLLEDKAVKTEGVHFEKALGMRLAFRQMPPMRCCTDQFLFFLNDTVFSSAYQTWANLTPGPIASLPPERFHFEVVNTSLEVC